MKSYKIIVSFEKVSEGYIASCPDLKGCITARGKTIEDSFENILKVIKTYIKTMPIKDKHLLVAKHNKSKDGYEIFTRVGKRIRETFR